MGKLFGTDGIRGPANIYPMIPEMAVNIGRAVAWLCIKNGKPGKIIIGKDTRISCSMLEYALASGICSAGGEAHLAGVLPTPAIAFLTSSTNADAGIVISASHNPYYDNGIKIFRHDGFKLSDEKEAGIEALILDNENLLSMCRDIRDTGQVYHMENPADKYIEFLKTSLPEDFSLKGMKIIIDCSNGAASYTAPILFNQLGADIEALFVNPDGKNINDNCGSQHTEILVKRVRETGADIGLAFDGDSDRLIAADEKGRVITGDQILAICAKHMKEQGILKNNLAVSTVMSNLGLSAAFKKLGIKHLTADVGDRYVMQKMLESGAVIGGEDSGHMIFLDHHTTGDGIMTALQLLKAVKASSRPLSGLAEIMDVFPQVLLNIEVTDKPDIENVPEIADAIQKVEQELGEQGRVLVRYSGTQPMCRVMVEGPTAEITRQCCQDIADVVYALIGKK
ncbi:Phosphoglucosamine mutase [Desulfonema limicola]|uniref:Phosphoglucosamine mutase n=1 Tax=Desulfonema limicola TaxID=45656 RepID=A0A975B7T5_9BACT|nr:phosphoglucosamine mutase [Desulfonema limicola]QTA80418.1 Phosphoglucosamine mutase [Desulfonema limicola]